MYKGKMYSVIFEQKPAQKEAMQVMAAELDKVQTIHKSMTFQSAIDAYIDSKRSILSPSQDEVKKILGTIKDTAYEISIILAQLAEKIKEQGYIYKGHPNQFYKCIDRVEKELGIPHFSLHKLRHYFASEMFAPGVPEADILKLGGWETDHVTKSVYRHSMMDKQEKAKREAAAKFQNSLFD